MGGGIQTLRRRFVCRLIVTTCQGLGELGCGEGGASQWSNLNRCLPSRIHKQLCGRDSPPRCPTLKQIVWAFTSHISQEGRGHFNGRQIPGMNSADRRWWPALSETMTTAQISQIINFLPRITSCLWWSEDMVLQQPRSLRMTHHRKASTLTANYLNYTYTICNV